MSDGSLLGDPGNTPLSKKQGVQWQRPRLTRQALMRCCLVKWILSSAAPQGSGRVLGQGWGICSELCPVWGLRGHPGAPNQATPPLPPSGDVFSFIMPIFFLPCRALSSKLGPCRVETGLGSWEGARGAQLQRLTGRAQGTHLTC